jgi:hypothetical protein
MPRFLRPYQYGLLLVASQLPSAGTKKKAVSICNCNLATSYANFIQHFGFLNFVISLFLLAWTNMYLPLVFPLKPLEMILSTLKGGSSTFL